MFTSVNRCPVRPPKKIMGPKPAAKRYPLNFTEHLNEFRLLELQSLKEQLDSIIANDPSGLRRRMANLQARRVQNTINQKIVI